MLNEFGVEVAEPGELVLIQVHHEELVRGREIRGLGGELERRKIHEKTTFCIVVHQRTENCGLNLECVYSLHLMRQIP